MEQTIGRMLYLAHRAVHDELDRRLHEHGASLWNWLLLDKAADADDASQRARSCTSSTTSSAGS